MQDPTNLQQDGQPCVLQGWQNSSSNWGNHFINPARVDSKSSRDTEYGQIGDARGPNFEAGGATINEEKERWVHGSPNAGERKVVMILEKHSVT
ncbi:hypothetical protein IFM61606_02369 [Aspergillus udagawae]|nr:hypothetical protein IFM51744_00206 [Aspergillus udagawae]GFG22508.1 hypothetical protein IFM61606_02369 [Aspergillus udagawae]